MPDTRTHRGQHPKDTDLFGPKKLPVLRKAVADLSWLLTRGYSSKAALELVGNHYSLTTRQRLAVGRAACNDAACEQRRQSRVGWGTVAGGPVVIDGYNQLITTEVALSGGLLFRGRDGALRDLASLHSTYRRVEETTRALELVGETLALHGVAPVKWYLDRPVSNSGRLRDFMLRLAEDHGWDWRVSLVWAPDKTVAAQSDTAISSDSWVLDHSRAWFNLTEELLAAVPGVRVVELAKSALAGNTGPEPRHEAAGYAADSRFPGPAPLSDSRSRRPTRPPSAGDPARFPVG